MAPQLCIVREHQLSETMHSVGQWLYWEDIRSAGGRNVCGSTIFYCIYVLTSQKIKKDTLKTTQFLI